MRYFRYSIFLLVTTLVLSEVIIRVFDHLIPTTLIHHLSQEALSNLHENHGQLQNESGSYFHYRPFQKIPFEPWIEIDENGFRNSIKDQSAVDVVLLGDSIIFARDAHTDLGDHFRKKQTPTMNLGIEGFAPQHYREIYRDFIIERDVKHKHVVINIFVGNDFADQQRYPWKLSPKASGNSNYPWIMNLTIGIIKNFNEQRSYDNEVATSTTRIPLPYKDLGVRYLWWQTEPDDGQFSMITETLEDIITDAQSIGSKPVLIIFPSPAAVYGKALYADFTMYYEAQRNIVTMFKSAFPKLLVLDPTDTLADAVLKKFIFISDSDCHLNDHGNEIFFEFLFKNLKSL